MAFKGRLRSCARDLFMDKELDERRQNMRELIAVTGASGFIGRELCLRLVHEGFAVKALQRALGSVRWDGVESVPIGDIGSRTDWADLIGGVSAVVHLAGRVHRMVEDPGDAAASVYEEINVTATQRLARAAARSKVKRLVFLSTVKVSGDRTDGRPFTEDLAPDPHGVYAISKWKAETALREIGLETGLEVVVIRSPLVYGPGVRANFLRLLRWVDLGIPLPLASINNKRSIIGLGNLISMIVLSLQHPSAGGETFFVSDGNDLSTPGLIRKIATALGRPCRLVPVPVSALRALGGLLGKSATISRLVESLEVDTSKARTLLDWRPPFSVDEELLRTARWYRERSTALQGPNNE